MNTIYLLFTILFGGAILTFLLGKLSRVLYDIVFLLTMAAAVFVFYAQIHIGDTVTINVDSLQLQWGLTAFGWLFSLMVLGLGLLAAIYSVAYMKGKDRLGYFYLHYLISIGAMMGILLSRDLVSFFIFWEIMTWASYFIVVYSGKDVQKTGIRYILFSAIGAYAMLMAIVIIYGQTNSISIDDLAVNYSAFSTSLQIWIPLLLMTAFAVKSALMPLHVWAPGAYANSPMAYTSVFSGALSKMGIYGMVIVFVTLIANLPQGALIREIIAWLGAITAVMGTFWAIAQDDAKKLLAYSSIGQLGYIIVGVAIGTSFAMMAALFMAVMHALFKGTLFMAVGAVERQTGTTDLTKVTGLIRKMPWTFIASLISIIALAGIPPVGGFVGKWMLYESLISSDHYLLVILIFFASTAGFLYCYKFLFGFFLGQEEKEWEHVKEAPALMVVPMLLMAFMAFILGVFPGILLKPVDVAMQSMGYAETYGHLWSMSVLFNEWGNQVMLEPLFYAIIIVFVVFLVFLVLKGMKGTRYVTTKDISTSGEIPLEHENLTFKENFFQPFLRAVEPVMKRQIMTYYKQIGDGLEAFFDFVRRIYSGNGQTYAIYVMIFLVILLLLKDNLFG